MTPEMKSWIDPDMWFWDEDGNRVEFVGACAEVWGQPRKSDPPVAYYYFITVEEPEKLRYPEYERVMLDLAEAGTLRLRDQDMEANR